MKPLSMPLDLNCPSEAGVTYQTEKQLSAPFHFTEAVKGRSTVHPNGTNESFKCWYTSGDEPEATSALYHLECIVQDGVNFGPLLQAV